jgi:Rieske Fe-S protein
VEEQAQLHPLKFLAGLARRCSAEGAQLFEETRATAVRSGDGCVVRTPGGRIRAGHVVIATQLPFLDRGLLFARAHPRKSFAVAAEVEDDVAPAGMYISADRPTRSIRSTPGAGTGRYLIVGGEGQRPGEEPRSDEPYRALERFMLERFGAEGELRWSAHDYVPADRLPYIGRIRRRDERVYAATGFAKWGLTKAMIAAQIVTDAIVGRRNPFSSLYDPDRRTIRVSAAALLVENVHVARRFVGDRLERAPGLDALATLPPGEGAIVRVDGRRLAVCRDDEGEAHVLSARCTHLGCIVAWSGADRTWECPCHGSRFAPDGTLLQGPATTDLAAVQSSSSPGASK